MLQTEIVVLEILQYIYNIRKLALNSKWVPHKNDVGFWNLVIEKRVP